MNAPTHAAAFGTEAAAALLPGGLPALAPPAVDRYRVFISYRRSDTELAAQQVYDRLCRRFGADRIFIDRQLVAGEHWEDVLRDRLERCTVFVLLIGNGFVAGLNERRASQQADPLEAEIRIALELEGERRLRVVPVLVGPQDMPAAEALPESLRPIRRVNAVWAHPLVFETAMGKLVQAIAAADYELRPIEPNVPVPRGALEQLIAAAILGALVLAVLASLPVLGYAVFWLSPTEAVAAASTSFEARLWYGAQYVLTTGFGGLAPFFAAWLVAELRVRASLPAFDAQGVLTAVAMCGMVYAGGMFLILSAVPGWRLQPIGLAPWFDAGTAPLPQWAMYTLLAGGLLGMVLLAPFLAIFEAWQRRRDADALQGRYRLNAMARRWLLRAASVLLIAGTVWLCASLVASLRAPASSPVIPVVGYLLLCPLLSLLMFSSQLARSYLGVRQRSWPFRLLLGLLTGLYLTSTLSLYAQGPLRVLELNAQPSLLSR